MNKKKDKGFIKDNSFSIKHCRRKTVVLVTVSVWLAILFFEYSLRLPTPGRVLRTYLWPVIFKTEAVGCRVSDPLLHHSLEPNCTARVKSRDDFDTIFTTNSFGLRSPEIEKEKPDGIFRILILGDSFTEGWGVAREETFSKVAERELNKAIHQNQKHKILSGVEVINAGVGSYSPILEATYLVNRGIIFNPDLVLVMVDSNDAKDDYLYGGWSRHIKLRNKEFPSSVSDSVIWPPVENPTLKRLLSPSKFATFVYEALKSLIDTHNKHLTQENLKLNGTLNINAVGWEDYDRMFELPVANVIFMRDFLKERGIETVSSVVSRGIYHNGDEWSPGRRFWGFEVGETYNPEPIKILEKKIRENNIDYIDTYQALINSGENRLYYPNDGHWTAKSHEIIGKEIASYILNNYINENSPLPAVD